MKIGAPFKKEEQIIELEVGEEPAEVVEDSEVIEELVEEPKIQEPEDDMVQILTDVKSKIDTLEQANADLIKKHAEELKTVKDAIKKVLYGNK